MLSLLAACSAPNSQHEDLSSGAQQDSAHDDSTHEQVEPGVVHLTPHQLDAARLETSEAQLRTLEAEIETTGQVAYEQDRVAHVGPRIPGRLVSLAADLGDQVRRGEVLAVLNSVELGEARSRHLAAVSHEELSRRTFERERALFERQIISEQKMQEAESAYLEASALRQGTEQTLRLYGVDPGRLSSNNPSWNHPSSNNPSSDNPASGDAPSRLEVTAPIDGRVVAKHATLGEMVTPSDSLFTLADSSRVWVWIDVFERDLAAVHEGDGVEVRVEAYPDHRFSGQVSYLASEVESQTRTVRARIDVPNAERLLRPGMFAEIRLTDPHGTHEASVLAIPESSLVRGREHEGDDATVYQPTGDGQFRAVPVRVGRRQGGWVEIVSGLQIGDAVVVEGTFFLKSELSRSELGGGHSH